MTTLKIGDYVRVKVKDEGPGHFRCGEIVKVAHVPGGDYLIVEPVENGWGAHPNRYQLLDKRDYDFIPLEESYVSEIFRVMREREEEIDAYWKDDCSND